MRFLTAATGRRPLPAQGRVRALCPGDGRARGRLPAAARTQAQPRAVLVLGRHRRRTVLAPGSGYNAQTPEATCEVCRGVSSASFQEGTCPGEQSDVRKDPQL